MGGHPAADLRNTAELMSPIGPIGPIGLISPIGLIGPIGLQLLRHLLSQLRMPLCKQDGGVARDGHRLQLLLLVGGLWVVDIVQLRNALFDTCLHV